jgi:predicted neutral ceramidase superfamily lipid hydrolase
VRNIAYLLNFLFCFIFNIFVYLYFKKKQKQKNDRRGSLIAKGGGGESILITIKAIFRFRFTGFITKLTIILVCAFVDGLMVIPFLGAILITFMTEILNLSNKTRFKVSILDPFLLFPWRVWPRG